MPRGEHNKLPKALKEPETKLEPATPKPNHSGHAGGPTKYDPKYCQMLIDHCAKGLSFATFSAAIDVNPDTLYEWCKAHPEFSEAKKKAQQACLTFWEQVGIDGMLNNKDFGSPIWIFNMKARFGHMGWTDKHEVSHGIAKDVDDNGEALDSSAVHEFLRGFSRGKTT